MIQIEEWKDIFGYEGYYQISNFGRVKRLQRMKNSNWGKGIISHVFPEKILCIDYSIGYSRVKLTKESFKKAYLVHRIVAEHFIDNIEKKLFVNHIDGNKINNNFINLEWVSAKENTEHAYKTGLMGWRSKKLKIDDVFFIRNSNEKISVLAKKFNISTRQIFSIRKREFYKNI